VLLEPAAITGETSARINAITKRPVPRDLALNMVFLLVIGDGIYAGVNTPPWASIPD
jgi:hypothetical protein